MSKIGCVGVDGSKLDINILVEAFGYFPYKTHDSIDPINLRFGRDFLKEDKKYDVVILFYIFNQTREELEQDPFYEKNAR